MPWTPWEMATRSLTVVCFIVVSCQNCYKHRSPKWTSLLPYPGIEIWRRKRIEMSLAEIHVPPISHIYFYLLGHHNRFDLGICWTSSIEKTQLSKSRKHTPTLRVFFTGKLPLGSNTSPFGPVISKKSGFLTYPQPPLALKNPCINRSALSCPWKMKAQRIMLYCSQQSHILILCEYKNMKKVEITGSHGS